MSSDVPNSSKQSIPAVKLPAAPLSDLVETHNAQIAYIAEGNGKLYLCHVESRNNQLSGCSVTGFESDGAINNSVANFVANSAVNSADNSVVEWSPEDIEFYTINGIKYAYIASNTTIFMCTVFGNNLVNCHSTGNNYTRELNWLPNGLKFINESGITYAYVTAFKAVYKCGLENDGNLKDCKVTGTSLLNKPIKWLPNSITFKQINGHEYAYIAASKGLFQCRLGLNGVLENCHQTGVSSTATKIQWHPLSVAFTQQDGGFFVYVADPNHLYVCNVNDKGELLNCTATGLDRSGRFVYWLARNVTFNFVNDKKYAYVVGVYNIYVCDANRSGHFTNCSIADGLIPKTQLKWNPNSIALH